MFGIDDAADDDDGPYSTDLGRCFRWVRDRVGRFDRCSRPVRWRGILVEIYGRRYAVDSCDRHRSGLLTARPLADPGLR